MTSRPKGASHHRWIDASGCPVVPGESQWEGRLGDVRPLTTPAAHWLVFEAMFDPDVGLDIEDEFWSEIAFQVA